MEESTLRHLLNLQVKSIRSKDVREVVETALENLPKSFWTRESSKKYHPEDERGTNGNLRHTLKVTKLMDRLLTSKGVPQEERDIGVACAILHDCMRHGLKGAAPWSEKNHPLLVRKFLKENCGLDTDPLESLNLMCTIIENHMGKWGYPPYYLTSNLSDLLHIADYIATQTDIEVKL